MDNLHQDLGHFFNDGLQYPKPLPASRNVELIRIEVSMPGPCCACKRSSGSLTCSRCKAIRYCSQDCQKNGFPQEYKPPWTGRHGWEDHKEICNKIKKHRKEAKNAIQALAKDFGGMDVLLRSIPKEPSFEDEDEDLSDESEEEFDQFIEFMNSNNIEEFDEHGDDIHNACWAFGNYGYAWNMSTAYPRNLEMFLRSGKILSEPSYATWLGSSPVEGFLQAAFDVDPTRFYGREDDLRWQLF